MIRSAHAEVRYEPDDVAARQPDRLLSGRPIRARCLAAGAGGLRAAGAARRGAPQEGRRGARRVPGDRRLQRRLGRARAARRRAAPARRRLRVRRIRAEPDGADAHAEAAVLQGRPGDAARQDSGRRVRRLHRLALRALGASSPRPASAPPSSISPATCRTTCSGSRTRPGTRCARAARRRATLDDLHQALKRLLAEQQTMFEGAWQRLTLAAARRAARGRARRRPRAAVGRRPHAPPPRRRLDGPGVALGAARETT